MHNSILYWNFCSSLSLFYYLSVCLSAYLSACMRTTLCLYPAWLCLCLSICLSVCASCASTCRCICCFFDICVCRTLSPCVFLSICVSVSLSLCLCMSVRLPAWLFLYAPACFCACPHSVLSVCLSELLSQMFRYLFPKCHSNVSLLFSIDNR